MVNTLTRDDLKEFVKNVLRSVDIHDEDISEKSNRSESVAHRKIIEALCNEWNRQFRVYPQSDFEGYKIDFIGRKKQLGRIALAVEVDKRNNEKSWLKLADISAICKVWILLDYQWEEQFPSETARKLTWNTWLNGCHGFTKASRFWYSYGPDAGELTAFVKSPDYWGYIDISSDRSSTREDEPKRKRGKERLHILS